MLVLTIMTWNVENLFRPAPGARSGEVDRYRAKLAELTRVITESGGDLVGLQEVGDSGAFADLLTGLGDRWSGVLSQLPDSRGIRVGWVSTGRLVDPLAVAAYPPGLPPTRVDDTGTEIMSTRRGTLAVTYVRDDGFECRALTAHFKSKLLSFPGPTPDSPRFDTRDEGERARFGFYALTQRAAEAVTVRAWASDVLAGEGQLRPVVVCGDLNDTPDAATTQILHGPGGSQLGTPGFEPPDRGDGMRLFNLAPAMPDGLDWSRINQGREELIDQILVSRRLALALQSTAAIPLDGVPSVTADPASMAGMAAPSDHRPVMATFDV